MKIFISGGTGFVGFHLSNSLLKQGHQVIAAARSHHQNRIQHDNFTYVSADLTHPGSWQEQLDQIDVAFNLAGKSIFTYWTEKTKEAIYNSRVLTTRNIVDALPHASTLISTSAVGYYGDRGDEILTEKSSAGDDFLAKVGLDWEKEAMYAVEKGARVALARFGIVLGADGGAMEKMIPSFRFFAGGPLGDGKQWFPWIHIDDLVGASLFIMENSNLTGPFNFTAPEPVTNEEFTNTLGNILKRPTVLRAPKFLIRMLAGEFGETLLNSDRAIPEKLIQAGYQFKFPKIEDALEDIAG